jgi:NADH dehydrogenase
VVIGSRRQPSRAQLAQSRGCEWRIVRFETMTMAAHWDDSVRDVEAVVNCVGVLRERGSATYDCVHHRSPAALALACARAGIRPFIHVSALGLHDTARSRFILSKLRGERAIRAARCACTIVRPSLLDGRGGYGARWLRGLARLPIHIVPADAAGRIAALDVRDAGEAIAALCEDAAASGFRDIELGGSASRTLSEHLAALRRMHASAPARCLQLPAVLARFASHLCDFLHLSPFSFGHLELLRRDNRPALNLLPSLLGRAPRPVGQLPAAPAVADRRRGERNDREETHAGIGGAAIGLRGLGDVLGKVVLLFHGRRRRQQVEHAARARTFARDLARAAAQRFRGDAGRRARRG